MTFAEDGSPSAAEGEVEVEGAGDAGAQPHHLMLPMPGDGPKHSASSDHDFRKKSSVGREQRQ